MSFTLDLRYQICMQPISLPVFNPVALELLQLLANDDTEISEVIDTINKDPALSIQVLRMANSSAYAGRYKSETIKESVKRLGVKQITNLAMAASQAALHASEIPLVDEMLQGLWQHSHACALVSRALASRTGHAALADQAYLAGLLHDIGKLYLLKAMEQICLNDKSASDFDQETILEVFSGMHVEQGCRIMDYWEIPQIYYEIVAHHHDDEYTSDDPLLAIVRLVNFKSIEYGLNRYPQFFQPADTDREQQLLAIETDDLQYLTAAMQAAAE